MSLSLVDARMYGALWFDSFEDIIRSEVVLIGNKENEEETVMKMENRWVSVFESVRKPTWLWLPANLNVCMRCKQKQWFAKI